MKTIRCSDIGLREFKKILEAYPILEDRSELVFVAKRNLDRLYLHNLIFPYGVARKYKQDLIPLESLVDASLDGYEKGLNNFFEETRDFKVGAYIVWWCQKYCTDFIINKIVNLNKKLTFNPFKRKELSAIMVRAKHEDKEALDRILYLYNLLGDQIEQDLLEDNGKVLNDDERMNVIKLAIKSESSRDGFEEYKNNIEFNDFFILEYLFALDSKYNNEK